MKILLVNPSCLDASGRDLYSANLLGPLFTFQPNKRMAFGIPLALPTLAAYTPPDFKVKIIDEEVEEINFDESVDIVAITAMTFKAKRAYEIAREFRSRGVKVVMGGIHATMCPDEALQHVDCVVIGEAEHTWPVLLADAVAGKLRNKYIANELPDLKYSLSPRYDLVKNDHYLYTYLQTTRGCPYDCTFCTVTKVSGRKLRKKTVEQVLAEVDSIISLNPKKTFNIIDRTTGEKRRYISNIAFIDDNFAIDRKHALSISSALKRFQDEHQIVIPWYTQVNVQVGFDEELLAAMKAANCTHLIIGFESLDSETLHNMKKDFNSPAKYEKAISNIYRHDIRIVFSTIVGDNNTSQQYADYLKAFIDRNNVFHVLLNILTPYPGTALHEKMKQDDSILSDDQRLYNIRNVVFKPENMLPNQLQELYSSLCCGIYRYDNMYTRGKKLLGPYNRLSFPVLERIIIWIGLSSTCLYLALKSKLRLMVAIRILLAAPYLILFCGSLFALELLVASADFDNFAESEAKRLKK